MKSKLRPYLKNGYEEIRRDGIRGLWNLTMRTYYKNMASVPGENLFDKDWDILIILDACRVDLFAEVAPKYDYLESGSINRITSVASRTDGWMENTFTADHEDQIQNTIYVSGNPHTQSHIDQSMFRRVDEVWRYGWDEDVGTVPPRPITDRGITHWHNRMPERMLLHYMQPHIPFIGAGLRSKLNPDQFGQERFDDTWLQLENGELSRNQVWDHYRANLEYVLDDIELLMTAINAENVVITSDHGNAFGEFGVFGHYWDIPIPVLRTVPWAETTARQSTDYNPPEYDTSAGDNVTDRLVALGYRDQ